MPQLTLFQKKEVLLYIEKYPQMSDLEVIDHFKSKFKCNIGLSTLRRWVATKDKIFEQANALKNKQTKRIKKPKYQEVEDLLFAFVEENEAINNPIRGDILKKKVK